MINSNRVSKSHLDHTMNYCDGKKHRHLEKKCKRNSWKVDNHLHVWVCTYVISVCNASNVIIRVARTRVIIFIFLCICTYNILKLFKICLFMTPFKLARRNPLRRAGVILPFYYCFYCFSKKIYIWAVVVIMKPNLT